MINTTYIVGLFIICPLIYKFVSTYVFVCHVNPVRPKESLVQPCT